MKKRILIAVLLCIALLSGTVLSGCAPAGVVVAKVGDEVITTTELKMHANFILLNYEMTLADISPDQIPMIYAEALDEAVNFKLLMKKGIEKKLYPLSTEDRKTIDTNVNQYLDDQLKALIESYTQQAATNSSINPDREARKALDKQTKETGLTRDNLILLLKYLKVQQLQRDQVTKDITAVTDAELKAAYDERVAQQKETLASSEAYEQAKYYETQGEAAVLVKPEGYRYVKHILLALPEDIQTQISDARSGGDDATANKLRDDELLKIKAKADEVLGKVNAGGDFDALMAEFGEDPGMKEEPSSKTGYELGSATGFIEEFKDAALKLGKIGDVTGLVPSDYGYHIIKWVGNVPSGALPLAEVTEVLTPEVLKDKQNKAWTAYVEQVKAEYKVEQYPEKLPTAPPVVPGASDAAAATAAPVG